VKLKKTGKKKTKTQKSKRKKSKLTTRKTFSVTDDSHGPPYNVWEKMNLFIDTCHGLKGKNLRNFVRQTYHDLFAIRPGPNIPTALVRAACGYELQYRGFIEYGMEHLISDRFKQNRECLLLLDVNKLHPKLGDILRISIRNEDKQLEREAAKEERRQAREKRREERLNKRKVAKGSEKILKKHRKKKRKKKKKEKTVSEYASLLEGLK